AVLPLVIVGAVGAARSAVAAGRRPRFPGRLTRSRGSWWPRGPGGQDDRGPRLSGRLPRLESGPEPFWPAGPAGHGNTGPRAPRAGRAEPGDHRARTPGAWPACGYEIALTAPGFAFACLHLAGLALAAAGCAVALRRFLRPRSREAGNAARPATGGERRGIPWSPPGAQGIPHVAREADHAGPPVTREGGVTPGESADGPGRPTQSRPSGSRPASGLVDSVLAVAI